MEVIFHVVPAAELQIGSSGVNVVPRPLGFYGSCPVDYTEHPLGGIYLHYFWKNIISHSFVFEKKKPCTIGEQETMTVMSGNDCIVSGNDCRVYGNVWVR